MIPRFVTFEGIDGAGKSSHIESLAGWIRARGHSVVVTREPGGTPLAEQLRAHFLRDEMDALTECLLVFAARRDHLRQRIEPALATGTTVLCDRFTDATFAYQGAGRGFDWSTLERLEQWVQGDRQPDLTLWFDVEPAEAAARRAAARQPDRLERLDEAFFNRVRAGYARRCAEHPRRILRLDAHGSVQAVWSQVEHEVSRRGWW
ncbi:MAG TPA: dTMP kinase [Burkholderiaceae bacterium]|nr:dTMP kinase [Burkholderiaceae bacterium]